MRLSARWWTRDTTRHEYVSASAGHRRLTETVGDGAGLGAKAVHSTARTDSVSLAQHRIFEGRQAASRIIGAR